jgi:hypothetical protein
MHLVRLINEDHVIVAEVCNTKQGRQRRFRVDETKNFPTLQEECADQHLGVTASPNENYWFVQGVFLMIFAATIVIFKAVKIFLPSTRTVSASRFISVNIALLVGMNTSRRSRDLLEQRWMDEAPLK